MIVGGGPERQKLEQLAQQLKLVKLPIFTGYRTDVANLYGVFDVFVLNSFAEGMSNTLLEAMACGLPVICTAVGGNSELIKSGQRGLQVPVANDRALVRAMDFYYSFPCERSTHGINARRYIEQKHSLNSMVRGYFDLYSSSAS